MGSCVHLGILFLIGLGVFGGVLGASLFQRMRIPQVVGYIVIGLLLGESGLKLIRSADVVNFEQLNLFALGVIGFLVGGELKGATFRQYGRQFAGILLGEGLAAFVLVGLAAGLIVYLTLHNTAAALAGGIVLGAIASATDPASTIDVLWEYRARGVLTTAIIATVALDDALAMSLYGVGTSLAGIIMGGSDSVLAAAGGMAVELLGSVAMGAAVALAVNLLLRHISKSEKALALVLGTLLMVVAVAEYGQMDVILATMAMGVVLTNVSPARTEGVFQTMRAFSSPIYVIFFVLVGARLTLSAMPVWLWWIVAAYVAFRTLGKMGGTWLGARATGAEAAVRKYCGLGLFAQGGVAVGLSIMASTHLGRMPFAGGLTLGDMIIFTVTATTLIVQLLGPPTVKLAVKLGGEIGRDVTEDDLIASYRVREVMNPDALAVGEHEPLGDVLRHFSSHDHSVLPVLDEQGRMTGIVSLDGMKKFLASTDTWRWLLATDVMVPAHWVVSAEAPLRSAIQTMRQLGVEQVPVVADERELRPVGILDLRALKRLLDQEIIARRQAGGRAGRSAAVPAPAAA